MCGVVLAVAEALAVEGEEVLLAAVFAPPQAARSRGRTTAMVPASYNAAAVGEGLRGESHGATS